jgi:hypothetical protein
LDNSKENEVLSDNRQQQQQRENDYNSAPPADLSSSSQRRQHQQHEPQATREEEPRTHFAEVTNTLPQQSPRAHQFANKYPLPEELSRNSQGGGFANQYPSRVAFNNKYPPLEDFSNQFPPLEDFSNRFPVSNRFFNEYRASEERKANVEFANSYPLPESFPYQDRSPSGFFNNYAPALESNNHKHPLSGFANKYTGHRGFSNTYPSPQNQEESNNFHTTKPISHSFQEAADRFLNKYPSPKAYVSHEPTGFDKQPVAFARPDAPISDATQFARNDPVEFPNDDPLGFTQDGLVQFPNGPVDFANDSPVAFTNNGPVEFLNANPMEFSNEDPMEFPNGDPVAFPNGDRVEFGAPVDLANDTPAAMSEREGERPMPHTGAVAFANNYNAPEPELAGDLDTGFGTALGTSLGTGLGTSYRSPRVSTSSRFSNVYHPAPAAPGPHYSHDRRPAKNSYSSKKRYRHWRPMDSSTAAE